MVCRQCGASAVCAACGRPLDPLGGGDPVELLEEMVNRSFPEASRAAGDEAYFLVLARGHRDLERELAKLIGDMGWVRILVDRRHDPTLLPREGREGTPR